MAKSSYKIPFVRFDDGTWHMLEWTSLPEGQVRQVLQGANGPYRSSGPDAWRDNKPFDAAVRLTGHYRGRSAARFNVENVDSKESYSMGHSGLYEAVLAFGATPGGVINGRWTFRKQGSNYGLYPLT